MSSNTLREKFGDVSIEFTPKGEVGLFTDDVEGNHIILATKANDETRHEWGGISLRGIRWIKDVSETNRSDGAKTLARYFDGISSSSEETFLIPLKGSLEDIKKACDSYDIMPPKIKTHLQNSVMKWWNNKNADDNDTPSL